MKHETEAQELARLREMENRAEAIQSDWSYSAAARLAAQEILEGEQ